MFPLTSHTVDWPLALELATGTEALIGQAVRYRDVTLPAGVMGRLALGPEGPAKLTYDGDGVFESTVAPMVEAIGPETADTTPPTVTITAEEALAMVVAEDAGTGTAWGW